MDKKVKTVFDFKKGGYYSIDHINEIERILARHSHKPDIDDKEVIKQQRGELSDYDIFDKRIRVTVEVFD